MQLSRQEVVDILRRAGLSAEADKAMAELPDPVTIEDCERWGTQYGVTKDLIISQMGGSP